jgi:hypothetical protein
MPALRPFGPGSMLIMWPRPHRSGMCGKKSTSFESAGFGRLQNSDFDMADLILTHECNRLPTQDAGTVKLTPLQHHSDEGQVIQGRRIEAAAAGEGHRDGLLLERLRLRDPSGLRRCAVACLARCDGETTKPVSVMPSGPRMCLAPDVPISAQPPLRRRWRSEPGGKLHLRKAVAPQNRVALQKLAMSMQIRRGPSGARSARPPPTRRGPSALPGSSSSALIERVCERSPGSVFAFCSCNALTFRHSSVRRPTKRTRRSVSRGPTTRTSPKTRPSF